MKTNNTPLDRKLIQEVLEYNPHTGELIWKEQLSFRAKKGSVAGTTDKQGYIQVGIKGKTIKAGRIVWLLFYGEDVGSSVIHFKDKNPQNLQITNLEVVSRKELAERRLYKGKNT